MGDIEPTPVPIRPRNEEAAFPALSFITIRDPSESKLPSQRKAVRSHAALSPASKRQLASKSPMPKNPPRKHKRKAIWRGDVIVLDVDPSSKPRYGYDSRLLLLPELRGHVLRRLSCSGIGLLGAGRVDPFRTYPVPWEPFIPELVDYCS